MGTHTSWLVASLVVLLVAAASLDGTGPDRALPLPEGEARSEMRVGETRWWAVDMVAGESARLQAGFVAPQDAPQALDDAGVRLEWVRPAALDRACTTNEAPVPADPALRRELDSRQVLADAEDPCAQAGTHLLALTLTGPEPALVELTVLASVIGRAPSPPAGTGPTVTPVPVEDTTAKAVSAPPSVGALAVAAATALGVLAVVVGLRRRREDDDTPVDPHDATRPAIERHSGSSEAP